MIERRVTCASASPGPDAGVVVSAVADGRVESWRMDQHVAAALMAALAEALGSSLLYDAGLERAAQLMEKVDLTGTKAHMIREAKIRKL